MIILANIFEPNISIYKQEINSALTGPHLNFENSHFGKKRTMIDNNRPLKNLFWRYCFDYTQFKFRVNNLGSILVYNDVPAVKISIIYHLKL